AQLDLAVRAGELQRPHRRGDHARRHGDDARTLAAPGGGPALAHAVEGQLRQAVGGAGRVVRDQRLELLEEALLQRVVQEVDHLLRWRRGRVPRQGGDEDGGRALARQAQHRLLDQLGPDEVYLQQGAPVAHARRQGRDVREGAQGAALGDEAGEILDRFRIGHVALDRDGVDAVLLQGGLALWVLLRREAGQDDAAVLSQA